MQKLHFSTQINAPKQKVWDVMLSAATYQQWTKAFDPTSRFVGNWQKGTQMRFLGTGEDGKEMGMLSEIADNIPYEFVSIKHLGVIEDGQEVKGQPWAGAFENYTFSELNGMTEVKVDIDVEDNFVKMFNDMWPKALQNLKQLAEQA